MKRYGQACAVARALDAVGERRNLLLARELTLGPQRYRDLDGETEIARRALGPLAAALTRCAPAI